MTEQVEHMVAPRRFIIRPFTALWSATAFANLADGIFKLALPLLVIHLTTTPVWVAGVVVAVRLPWLFFALFAGVIADRFDRRKTMIVANMTRTFMLGLLVVAIWLDILSLPLIYMAALALGVAETLADTASASILPSIVEKSRLERANARLVGAVTVTNEFIGPPLGGLLAGVSLSLAFTTSSALYLVAAVAMLLISGTFRANQQSVAHLWTDLTSGLWYVWDRPVLRTLAVVVAVMNLCWSAWLSIIVLYVVTPGPGGLSEIGYGLMLTSIGIGGLVGTLLTVPLVERFGHRAAIGSDIFGTFLMLMVPALTANAWLIGVAAVIGGIGGAMWSIVVSSIRQSIVPDHMQGKTASVYRLFGYGALPLGAALAGLIAEWVSIPVVFGLCALLTALLIIPFVRVLTADGLQLDEDQQH